MLEWFTSRLTVAVATILLLSSVTSYYAFERNHAAASELKTVAEGIAFFIDMTLRIEGESTFTVSYSDDGDLSLPANIGGRPYHVRLRNDAVALQQQGSKVMGYWTGILHLWRPVGAVYSSTRIESEDMAHDSLDLDSGRPFQIELRSIQINGIRELQAFAYVTNQ